MSSSSVSFKKRLWSGRACWRTADQPPPVPQVTAGFICVKWWEACVSNCCKKSRVDTYTCQTAMHKQQALGSSLTFSDRRSCGLVVCCIFAFWLQIESRRRVCRYKKNNLGLKYNVWAKTAHITATYLYRSAFNSHSLNVLLELKGKVLRNHGDSAN